MIEIFDDGKRFFDNWFGGSYNVLYRDDSRVHIIVIYNCPEPMQMIFTPEEVESFLERRDIFTFERSFGFPDKDIDWLI